MTADLVAFLNARLDEDYRLAFEAGNGGPDRWVFDPELPWNSDVGPREAVVRFNGSALGYVAAVDPVHGKYGTWDAQHIARHDPARVLVEVDAKRRIIAEHSTQKWSVGDRVHDCQWEGWPCTTLRLLALPYAGHPDYQAEWAPRT